MAIFQSFLQGAQAKQAKQAAEQTGELRGMQMQDILTERKRLTAQDDRTARLTGLRTDYLSGVGDPQAQAETKRQIFAISPEESSMISEFEDEADARRGNAFGQISADLSYDVGQPSEQQGLERWADAQVAAGRTSENVQRIMDRYAQIPDPAQKTLFLQGIVDRDLAQGEEGRKFQDAMRANAPGERRIIKGADGRNYYADTQELVIPGMEPKVTGSGVTVNVGGEDVGIRPEVMDIYTSSRDTMQSAAKNEKSYEKLLNVVSKVDTGTFAEMKVDAQKALASLGFDVDMTAIANAEQLRSLAMGEVLKLIDQTKGAISEKEMDAFERASINLGNTPAGNALLAKAGIAAARRSRQLAEGLSKFIRSNPGVDRFAVDDEEDRLIAELSEQPIFTEEEMATLNEIGGGAGEQAPAAPQQITSDEDYNALPSGAQFIDPEGNRRTKP